MPDTTPPAGQDDVRQMLGLTTRERVTAALTTAGVASPEKVAEAVMGALAEPGQARWVATEARHSPEGPLGVTLTSVHGEWQAACNWDGCVHLYAYDSDGPAGQAQHDRDIDHDYMHVCDVGGLIADLIALDELRRRFLTGGTAPPCPHQAVMVIRDGASERRLCQACGDTPVDGAPPRPPTRVDVRCATPPHRRTTGAP